MNQPVTTQSALRELLDVAQDIAGVLDAAPPDADTIPMPDIAVIEARLRYAITTGAQALAQSTQATRR